MFSLMSIYIAICLMQSVYGEQPEEDEIWFDPCIEPFIECKNPKLNSMFGGCRYCVCTTKKPVCDSKTCPLRIISKSEHELYCGLNVKRHNLLDFGKLSEN